MISERESLTSPEERYEVLLNGTSETIPAGGAVCYDGVTADGVKVAKPTASTLGLFVGIADVDVAPGDYFRVQIKGPRMVGALVRNDAVTDIVPGDILIPVADQWYLQRGAVGDGLRGRVTAFERYIAGSLVTALKRVIVHSM